MITIANVYLTDVRSFNCVYSNDETSGDLASPEFEGMEELDTGFGPPVLLVDPPDNLARDKRITKVKWGYPADNGANNLLIKTGDDTYNFRWLMVIPIEYGTNLVLLKWDPLIGGEFVEGPGYAENLPPILFGR